MRAPIPIAALAGLLLLCPLPASSDGQPSPASIQTKSPEEVLKGLYGRSMAVVVGINRYPTAGPGFMDLNYAVADARAVAAQLEHMGFQVRLLLDDEATSDRIIQVLGDEVGASAAPQDRLLFYFAGHGDTRDKADGSGAMGFILPYDYDPEQHRATSIALDKLAEMSSEFKARHMLYVMDSCFSGEMLKSSGRTLTLANFDGGVGHLNNLAKSRAHVVLTAGSRGQKVHESSGHGVFTSLFLKALSQGHNMPWSEKGYLTARDLGAYIGMKVPELVPEQTPQYGRLDGEGDVVLALFKPIKVYTEATEQRAKQEAVSEYQREMLKRSNEVFTPPAF
jgi:uncharacterized caspase-like protein